MYRPCYAPVFPASSAIDCALLHIRLAILLVFLILLLLVTFGNEGVMCLIRRTQFRMQHCREGNDDPRIDLGFTLLMALMTYAVDWYFYKFFAAIETTLTALVVWYAWNWPRNESNV